MSAQPSNRGVAPPRSPPRPAPVTWRLVSRVLAIATVVALFFALLAPFGSGVQPLIGRAGEMLLYGWLSALIGLATVRLAYRLGIWRLGFGLGAAITALLMVPAVAATVLIVVRLMTGSWLPLAAWPQMLWQVGLLVFGVTYLSMAFAWRRIPLPAAEESPRFLERIPLRLRDGELWAVEAEDHYLRLHTSKGQDLILMRLSDAIDELGGIEGAQVHRSWWVARNAIADAERGDGRATLTLKDGSQVPVSRTYARMLRERKWI